MFTFLYNIKSWVKGRENDIAGNKAGENAGGCAGENLNGI